MELVAVKTLAALHEYLGGAWYRMRYGRP